LNEFLTAGNDMPGLKELSPSRDLENTIQWLIHYSASTEIDWNVVLRVGNSWFDRIADPCRKPTRWEQRVAFKRLDEEMQSLKKAAGDETSLNKAMLDNPRRALSERLGQVMLIMFLPPVGRNLDDRATMTFEMTKLGFALAAYRADHNAYPAKLADLMPKYVREVPRDVFHDSVLHYRRESEGYLLYSVGANGRDDGGKGFENERRGDKSVGQDWDDIVVRVPVPARK
jgi:hypothetical protein